MSRVGKSIGLGAIVGSCLLLLVSMVPAVAGWLPPKPAGDGLIEQVPISRQVVKAALADPKLQEAARLALGPEAGWPQALPLLDALAKSGNPVAQTALCATHKLAHGVAADWAYAARWCLEAAKQGYAPAQYEMAVLLHASAQAKQDEIKLQILHWLRQAAGSDLQVAYLSLVRLYAIGDGVPKDAGIAAKLLAEAGKLSGSCARLAPSAAARYGIGGAVDDKKANADLLAAAKAQCWPAQYALAGYLKQGAGGMAADPTQSLSWAKAGMAAELADAYGQPVK
jgi:TPR repeat protein